MVRAILISSFLLAASCFGQNYGFGSVAFPGTGHPPGVYSGGQNRYGYGRHEFGRGGFRGSSVIAYPVYIGGYGGYGGYGSGYADQGPAPVQVAPAPPTVVINQYFGAQPGPETTEQPEPQSIHIFQQPPAPIASAPEPASENHTYLIAYKDHSVYTALAYWIEGQTLHYVTTANTHNQADLSLIDVDFSRKLNTDRNMPFNVP